MSGPQLLVTLLNSFSEFVTGLHSKPTALAWCGDFRPVAPASLAVTCHEFTRLALGHSGPVTTFSQLFRLQRESRVTPPPLRLF